MAARETLNLFVLVRVQVGQRHYLAMVFRTWAHVSEPEDHEVMVAKAQLGGEDLTRLSKSIS